MAMTCETTNWGEGGGEAGQVFRAHTQGWALLPMTPNTSVFLCSYDSEAQSLIEGNTD